MRGRRWSVGRRQIAPAVRDSPAGSVLKVPRSNAGGTHRRGRVAALTVIRNAFALQVQSGPDLAPEHFCEFEKPSRLEYYSLFKSGNRLGKRIRMPILKLSGISKRFGATIALDGVDLELGPLEQQGRESS